MPLYEYECAQCKRRMEKIQKFSDAPLTVCPHCGGPLEKVLHAPAISFKGGGWYADLYSKGKPPSAGDKGDKGGQGDAAAAGPASGESSGAAANKESAPASTPAPSAPAAAPAPAPSSNTK